MAREVVIYEQVRPTPTENGAVRCLFVYPTSFVRAGQMLALTPLSGLEDNLQILLNADELTAISEGRSSYELYTVSVARGTSQAQRDTLIFQTYREARDLFKRTVENPKKRPEEYLDLP